MALCLQEKNRSANQSLVRQASSVGQLEAHEHELETVLKLKVGGTLYWPASVLCRGWSENVVIEDYSLIIYYSSTYFVFIFSHFTFHV